MISILEQRVLHQTSDISLAMNNFRAGTYTFPYTVGQYLYIGSFLPFNNMFFEIGTPNAVAATVSVDIWYGQQWVPAVDIIDETSGLFNSGRIQWNTNINKGWDREQYSKDVTGLSVNSKIYNMYWLRMSWNATLTATMVLKFIGQKFASDAILYSHYPDLNNQLMRDSYDISNTPGSKTTWDEQHYMAAEKIIADLKKRDIIKSQKQILDYTLFEEASCHALAKMAYTAFGQPYFDQLETAVKDYKDAMNPQFFNVDKNADGRLDDRERALSTSFGRR